MFVLDCNFMFHLLKIPQCRIQRHLLKAWYALYLGMAAQWSDGEEGVGWGMQACLPVCL